MACISLLVLSTDTPIRPLLPALRVSSSGISPARDDGGLWRPATNWRRFLAIAGWKFFLDEVRRIWLRVFTLISMVAPQDPLLVRTATITNAEIEVSAPPKTRAFSGSERLFRWLRLTQLDDEILERLDAAQRQNRSRPYGRREGPETMRGGCRWNLFVPRADSWRMLGKAAINIGLCCVRAHYDRI